VDIELITSKVGRIAHKFVGERESSIVNREWMTDERQPMTDDRQPMTDHRSPTTDKTPPTGGDNLKLQTSNLKPLTLLWCCKEAVFKWYGKGKVDFREHIHVKSIIDAGDDSYNLIVSFNREEELFLDLRARFFDELCLGYVVT
jgi:hypothetical protein